MEVNQRVTFIRDVLQSSGAQGIVFGNSGGKDCALVGILCKKACDNTVGAIMPCGSKRNYALDRDDALTFAAQYNIETRQVDLSPVREAFLLAVSAAATVTDTANINIAPRLRMTTLNAIAASENRLVAGTGNRSERYMGYFTKWGDGAFDFNPIADLTVTEVFEFLRHLGAPDRIIDKAPSAGLFDGQTDEQDMGVTYAAIDKYLFEGTATAEDLTIIERYHAMSEHKRQPPPTFGGSL